MAIVAVIEDLIFRAKVEAAASRLGVSLTLAPDASAAVQAMRQASASLLVVDLDHATQDSVEIVRTVRRASSSVRITGYCAHIHTDLRARAAAAGCTEVLPRSVFVQRLTELCTEISRAGEAELRERLRREGLRPIRWSNGPDAVYGEHEHPYGKILVVASGSLLLTIKDGSSPKLGMAPRDHAGERHKRVVSMKRGDRVDLPPHTTHSAIVGAEGVVCLEAHVRRK